MLPWQPFLAFYIWGAHWRHLKNTTEPSMCGGDVALCQITLTTCLKRLKRAGLLLEQDCYHRIYCNFTRHQSECASPVCIPLSPSLKPSIWRPFSVGLSISFFVILCLLLMLLHRQWLAFHPCFYVELYCILLRKCMCNQAFLAFGLINFTSVINGLPLARWQTWGPLFSADFVWVCVSVCVSGRHFYPSVLTAFDKTWSQGPYSDLVWPQP